MEKYGQMTWKKNQLSARDKVCPKPQKSLENSAKKTTYFYKVDKKNWEILKRVWKV